MRVHEIDKIDLEYRRKFTKVRGGWSKDKIKKELRHLSSLNSPLFFNKEIAKFESPDELKKNLFYHGSGGGIGELKPSISLSYVPFPGGGYEQKYWGISLSKDREVASSFTGNSHNGSVAPVVVRRDAVIIEMPNFTDAIEIEDIIESLWDKGIDAVLIGNHDKHNSEKEIVILNPKCIVVGKSTSFKVMDKEKTPSFTDEKIKELWLESGDTYKKEVFKSWENGDESFFRKYGKRKDPNTKWNSKNKRIKLYHEESVAIYNRNSPSIPSTLGREVDIHCNYNQKIT